MVGWMVEEEEKDADADVDADAGVDVEGCGRDGLDGGCDDEGEGWTGDCTGDGTGDCTGVGTPVDGDDGVDVGVVVDPPNSRHNPIIVSP